MKMKRKLKRKWRKFLRKYFKRPLKKKIGEYGKKHPGFRKAWRRTLYLKRRLYYWWRSRKAVPMRKRLYLILLTEKPMGAALKQSMNI